MTTAGVWEAMLAQEGVVAREVLIRRVLLNSCDSGRYLELSGELKFSCTHIALTARQTGS